MMQITGLRTFIPTIDFEKSKLFYKALGFQVKWENDDLAIVGVKDFEFFLQKFYVEDWANNFMMQLFVDDIKSFYDVVSNVYQSYENTKLKPIFEADYGYTFHLIDPAGVLWHVTERKTDRVVDENKLLCENQ
ncbi:MAG: lactoylglutathione lyase [Acholeplasmataceae bacterium]